MNLFYKCTDNKILARLHHVLGVELFLINGSIIVGHIPSKKSRLHFISIYWGNCVQITVNRFSQWKVSSYAVPLCSVFGSISPKDFDIVKSRSHEILEGWRKVVVQSM